MKNISKKNRRRIILAGVAVLLLVLAFWGNTALEVNTWRISSEKLPGSFSGFRIAQISDLHNASFGENNERLLSLLEEVQPDMIAITGDLIDSRRTDVEVALAFAREAVKIAPCYYVTGNHEARVAEYAELKAGLEAAGVTVLENEKITVQRSGEKITVLGVDDPSFLTDYLFGDAAAVTQQALTGLIAEEDGYTILLAHRPELFDVYAGSGVDLVFSGHAHGGQFRLPLIGGLVAPNQGLFPTYDSGLYTQGSTNMLVSRGIGNSIIPLRINNRPEIVVAVLQSTIA